MGGVYSRREGYILGGGDIFWEGGVYSGREGYILRGGYIMGGRGIFWEGGVYASRDHKKGDRSWEGGRIWELPFRIYPGVDSGAPTFHQGINLGGGIFQDCR